MIGISLKVKYKFCGSTEMRIEFEYVFNIYNNFHLNESKCFEVEHIASECLQC